MREDWEEKAKGLRENGEGERAREREKEREKERVGRTNGYRKGGAN